MGAKSVVIAADLLSQAEHDESAQSLLMTDDFDFARKVCAEVERFLDILPRSDCKAQLETVRRCNYRRSTRSPGACRRHRRRALEIITQDPDQLLESINHAGSIFAGPWTPEIIGDYVGGPNHAADIEKCLVQFRLVRMISQTFDHSQMMPSWPLAAAASRLARAEGLQAHALAVDLRLAANDREN